MDQITADGGNLVLLTGGTGYVGGRLGQRLLDGGYRVRCLVRSARKLQSRPWAGDPRVEVVEGDLLDVPRLADAMRGCAAAYYLVHSMVVAGKGYAERDRRLAEAFAEFTDTPLVPAAPAVGAVDITAIKPPREVEPYPKR